jgi:hypothetical protein
MHRQRYTHTPLAFCLFSGSYEKNSAGINPASAPQFYIRPLLITFVFSSTNRRHMELSGKIIQALDEQSGTGRNGTWRKRDYILETPGQYPKKVCLTVWGDKIDQFNIQAGQEITASIEVESREYNGRWYTDVKIWRVNNADNGTSGGAAGNQKQDLPDVSTFSDESEGDILPF